MKSEHISACIPSPGPATGSPRPLSSSSRSSCDFPSLPYPKQGEEGGHYPSDSTFPRRAAFSSSSPYPSSRLSYPPSSSQGSPMYCSPSSGSPYQYSYPQSNGSYPREQYQGQYAYPNYPSYDSQGAAHQSYPASYQGYKQGYGEYGSYYYNCPSSASEAGPGGAALQSANSNTPLPPDFSYVANHTSSGGPDPAYSDFYAMG